MEEVTSNVSETNETFTDSTFDTIHYICFTYIYKVIYAVGLLGNTFALIVWTRSGLRASPVPYFQAICVADSCVLVMHAIESYHSVHVPGVCQLVHVLFLAVQVFAILLMLGMCFERYIEICHPLAAEVLVTHKRTVWTIMGLALVSIVVSTCEAYTWHVKSDIKRCVLRRDVSLSFLWTYAILILSILFVLPLFLIILINVVVATRIKKRRRDSYAFSRAMVPDRQKLNVSFMFISLYLAVCEIIYAFVHISQYVVPGRETLNDPARISSTNSFPLMGRWHSYFVQSTLLLLFDVLALTSYAVDLTIFTLCSKTFRRSIRELFQRYRRRKSLIMGYREPGLAFMDSM